ncbi:MAG: zinc ribbon domain-containing protein [Lachnospiraceae bacterium]|nr:zinc ribbon domain-containing protein [Lachnospiraceae bacterium]
MGFFDTLSETLASTSKVVGSKTKEVASTTKLSIQISQEEARLKKAYEALGEAYFKNHEEDMPEQYAVYGADIREAAARLDSLMKEKQILKNQKRCVSCGAWIPNEDRFCGKCGAENEILEKEAEAEKTDSEEVENVDAEQVVHVADGQTENSEETE